MSHLATVRTNEGPDHHTTGPEPPPGQGTCMKKAVCNRAHGREGTPQALPLPAIEFPLLCMFYGRGSGKGSGPGGGKKNAWSPEHNEQNLKLWKDNIKNTLVSPGATSQIVAYFA